MSVCVFVSLCVYLHLCRYISLIFYLIKRYNKNQEEVAVAKDRQNSLELLAHLHQAKKCFFGKDIRIK